MSLESPHSAAGRAGGLVRISVHRPSDLTFYVSPIRQRELNRERATRDGYSVVEEFTDLDASAWRDNERPGFQAAVAALLAREIEVLYVPKVDRLTRQGMGAIGLLLDELERVGGRIVFVADGLDSSRPGERQMIGLLAEQARAESNNISWRAAQSREASRRLGRWASSAHTATTLSQASSGRVPNRRR
jgi:site-specific DNA recombinase